MDSLNISPTFKTPEIQFDAISGDLQFKGRVFPENPKEFFAPVIEWLRNYSSHPAGQTTLILNLSYFNSSSNEYIFRVCKLIEAIADQDNPAKIVWEYEEEDEDMRQLGEDYKELLKINFEIKAVH